MSEVIQTEIQLKYLKDLINMKTETEIVNPCIVGTT